MYLKPVYDRVVLSVLAHGLFGDVPDTAELARALWSQGRRGLLADLSARRLSPSRSLLLPVSQLEALRGLSATGRRHTLTYGVSSAAHSALVTCLALELVVTTGLWGALFLMGPDELDLDVVALFTELRPEDDVFAWLGALIYVVAVSAVEPLYVSFGFGLYLNRRTELEGWDVELSFRRLARRLSKLAVVGIVVLGGLAQDGCAAQARAEPNDIPTAEPAPTDGEPPVLVMPYTGLSERDEQRARRAIDAVMAKDELFVRETQTRWEPNETEEPSQLPLSLLPVLRWMATGLEWLLWATLVAALSGAIAYAARRYREREISPLRGLAEPRAEVGVLPERAARLPLSQVSSTARAHLQSGELVEALGVLYGGAIRSFVEREGLRLGGSATENDCVREVERAAGLSPPQRVLFERVTRAWVRAAYGHRPPARQDVDALCDGYDAAFGRAG